MRPTPPTRSHTRYSITYSITYSIHISCFVARQVRLFSPHSCFSQFSRTAHHLPQQLSISGVLSNPHSSRPFVASHPAPCPVGLFHPLLFSSPPSSSDPQHGRPGPTPCDASHFLPLAQYTAAPSAPLPPGPSAMPIVFVPSGVLVGAAQPGGPAVAPAPAPGVAFQLPRDQPYPADYCAPSEHVWRPPTAAPPFMTVPTEAPCPPHHPMNGIMGNGGPPAALHPPPAWITRPQYHGVPAMPTAAAPPLPPAAAGVATAGAATAGGTP